MPNMIQPRQRLVPNALRRTIGRDMLGMFRLQLLQLCQELIVLTIGDYRRRFDVISPVVLANDARSSAICLAGVMKKRAREK